MRPLTWISILAAILLIAVFPLVFAELMAAGLGKLGLSPTAAAVLVIAIVVGGFVNIPVRRIAHDEEIAVHPFAVFGLPEFWPRLRRLRRETVICVNVGGCLIPAGLAAYELAQLAAPGGGALLAAAVATGANCAVCYFIARPVPGVGIVMPGLVSPFVAATFAMVLAPDQAPPLAFVAGVLGPLIGADLLHLKDVGIGKGAIGIVSIGGAGTFDGIVLSGILAAYLA